jgi:hypothetical protein
MKNLKEKSANLSKNTTRSLRMLDYLTNLLYLQKKKNITQLKVRGYVSAKKYPQKKKKKELTMCVYTRLFMTHKIKRKRDTRTNSKRNRRKKKEKKKKSELKNKRKLSSK